MRQVSINVLKWFGFYVLYFQVFRVVFFFLNGIGSPNVTLASLTQSAYHGLIMDFSIAAYVTMVNVILYLLLLVSRLQVLGRLITVFNRVIILTFGVFLVINARLFNYWGYHIDASILKYLATPKEAMASASFKDWFIVIAISVILVGLFELVYSWACRVKKSSQFPTRWAALLLILFAGVLILPIRGGTGVAALSVSSVYFSKNNFENQLAINPVWNAVFSLTVKNHKLQVSTKEEANSVQKELSEESLKYKNYKKLGAETNVILIVLESFTANVVSSIGGFDSITPELNKWMSKGISFHNCYSSGDRSDKGLTTLFTGFPSLPNDRLLSYPRKLQAAPNVYRNFNKEGYFTSFYYGGNLDFANIGLIFNAGEVDKLVTEDDFNTSLNSGKWGVRDGIMFNQFTKDITSQKQPFFSTLYTLSSHEPFDIPAVSFESEHRLERFFKAVYYTDSCLGAFMNKLERSEIWSNSVVIITSDHGVKNPGNLVTCSPRKFRIPLLITGGVIDTSLEYSHFVSHTDIPYTVEQMIFGRNNSEYQFSKSLFDSSQSYAHYYYQTGAAMINNDGCIVYDIPGGQYIVNRIEGDSLFNKYSRQLLGISQKVSDVFNSY